jgi:hypothetical protein
MSDKQIFTSVSSSSGFAGLEATMTIVHNIITTYHMTGSIDLLAFQNGGDPSQLAKIFVNGTNGYFITSCNLSNLSACNQVIDGVIDYAANNFANQINITNGQVYGNVAQLGYTFSTYTELLGLQNAPTIITPAIEQARGNLESLDNQMNSYNSFMAHLLSSWVVKYMDPTTLQSLKNTFSNITSNINLLLDQNTGGIDCYETPQDCVAIEQNIIESWSFVNDSFIDRFSKAYELHYGLHSMPSYIPNYDGIAYPVGNNKYVKVQTSSGIIEQPLMQIWQSNNTLFINETSIGFVETLSPGIVGYNWVIPQFLPAPQSPMVFGVTCYEIDNPI